MIEKDSTKLPIYFILFFASFMVAMFFYSAYPVTLAEEESFKIALDAAIKENGPFYTWTLTQKAAFYDQHVYHGIGTRRGIPDERHIPPETVEENAPALLSACLDCDAKDLSQYTIDLDFWIEAFTDSEDKEHEFYSVCFLRIDEKVGTPHNVYQIMVSAYSGELIEAIDMETGWVWKQTSHPALDD